MCIQIAKSSLLSGPQLLMRVIVFYAAHVQLIVLSVVPSSVRAYQIHYQYNPLIFEIIVEASRLLMVLLAVYFGNMSPGKIYRVQTWKSLFQKLISRTSSMKNSDWIQAVVSYMLLMAIIGLFNLIIGSFITSSALVYFIKNITVIPITLLSVLKLIRWISF
ncbi:MULTISPECIES: hypothetical protein [Paenibacillus]|uniref:hypothetical protein n=1 Tax=Paenibacillus TaxID=44249 RepID=UPI0011A7684F|nr:hypothetical protein [Paenibacillus sp. IHBB 10380]